MSQSPAVLAAVILCAAAGCWEEIHYTGPDPTVRPERSASRDEPSHSPPPSTPPVTSPEEDSPAATDTASFADELATSLEAADSDDRDAETNPPTPPEQSVSADSNHSPAAVPAAGSEPPPAAEPQHNTRRLAWLLGSKLSLAALKSDRGAPPADVAKLLEQSQYLAEFLGTTVSDLPPPAASSDVGRSPDGGLNYLFSAGRTIGRDLAGRQGDDHAALFELAVKSNVLLALYRPDAPITGTLAGAIRQASGRAKLPTQLSQPLLDKLDRGAPAAEVQDAVFAMYADVDRYLSAAAP